MNSQAYNSFDIGSSAYVIVTEKLHLSQRKNGSTNTKTTNVDYLKEHNVLKKYIS